MKQRRWIVPVAIAVAVLALAAAGVIFMLMTRQPEAPPAGFPVVGSILVRPHTGGADCTGDSGYEDIKTGAQVAITDSTGKTVGLGSLVADGEQVLSDTVSGCRFTFAIPNVPAGSGFYGVEVSHRGKVQFSESDLRAGNAKLQVGRFS